MKMLKLLSLFMIFCFSIAISATYAAQCPSGSDWAHTEGSEWKLSESAIAEGWQILGSTAKESKQTSVSNDADLSVTVSSNSVTCNYYLKNEPLNVLTAYVMGRPVDLDKISMPPFIYDYKEKNYVCRTVSGTPENCSWYWRN